jgi:hypothetical protein
MDTVCTAQGVNRRRHNDCVHLRAGCKERDVSKTVMPARQVQRFVSP